MEVSGNARSEEVCSVLCAWVQKGVGMWAWLSLCMVYYTSNSLQRAPMVV
jgi:hypothetical protein